MSEDQNIELEKPVVDVKKKGGCIKGCLTIFVIFIFLGILIGACSGDDEDGGTEQAKNVNEVKANKEEKPVVLTQKQKMFAAVTKLINQKLAFDTGNYIAGEIPKGEYVFIRFEGSGQYYSEQNGNGNIIDNENFDSFGYVYVHGLGNITTRGLLVSTSALPTLEVTGAKQLYEIFNDKTDYKDAGWYKIGVDLPAGQYVFESYGQAYVAKMKGPIGNSDIIDNKIFNGKYSITVSNGQYLKVSRAILQ